MSREGAVAAQGRWAQLRALQEHYRHFSDLLQDVMEELGFGVTDIQDDIAQYMEHGDDNIMVQAQRSQAKTTIAAAFCVFCIIHNPRVRILVVSAGGSQAGDISTLIVRIIMSMDVLACLRPDRTAGDRSSTESFEVHHSLKGVDKSPTVKCLGITANLQGNRADILLADDVESTKNGMTATQRAQLLHLTKDFTSIVQNGRIIWLGTPQTGESIYNSLPARGVRVRIWPGRYPTAEQIEHYGANLAPLIQRRLAADPSLATGGGMLGDQGQPVDPVLLNEEKLQAKELDQGTAYFQLQHMLCTKLLDQLRYPLKPELLTCLRGAGTLFPLRIVRGMEKSHLLDYRSCDFSFKVMSPHETSRETAKLNNLWACIDPAAGGANADETAYAVGGFLNGNIVLLSVGGIPGGYELPKMEALAKLILRFPIEGVTVEKNMGYGAFAAVFTPVLQRIALEQGMKAPGVLDELVTGQKEARIINTLSPVMGRGALIVTPECIAEDHDRCQSYAPAVQQTYSLFYQLAKISYTRGALVHDDRADAVEALVRRFQASLRIDQDKEVEKLTAKAALDKINSSLKMLGAKPLSAPSTSMLRRRR